MLAEELAVVVAVAAVGVIASVVLAMGRIVVVVVALVALEVVVVALVVLVIAVVAIVGGCSRRMRCAWRQRCVSEVWRGPRGIRR